MIVSAPRVPALADLRVAGSTATAAILCATATVAVVDADPPAAVIVAVPLPTAVTTPAAFTVATVSSLDSHENSAPATTLPLRFRNSALSDTVSPSADNSTAAGVMVC